MSNMGAGVVGLVAGAIAHLLGGSGAGMSMATIVWLIVGAFLGWIILGMLRSRA